jgi:alkylresorcinol/alkylpyrone synthase
MPALLSLATVEAPYPVAQDDARAATLELFSDANFDLHELAAVFDNAGIERRTTALPLERYVRGMDVAERNAHYLDVSRHLLTDAARRALTPALSARLTHVVSVSSSGVATPTLECGVIEDLALPLGVRRVPVFGLGCAGGAAGLQLARDLARDPEAYVLLLCVELTSLTLLTADASRRNFVACALFGDGAAAAVIGRPDDAHPARAELGGGVSRFFENTHDLMGWDVVDGGWRVVFSPRIPAVVRRQAAELVDAATGGRRPRRWVLHPGGAKILEAYEAALTLDADDLAPARGVLARHGNMSAATVLFVLEELLARERSAAESAVLTAFGPGFTAEACALELCATT